MDGRDLSHTQGACSAEDENDHDAINQRDRSSRGDGDGQRRRDGGPTVADVPSYGYDGEEAEVARRLSWSFDGA